MKIIKTISFILFITLLISCKKETEILDLHYEYFPVEIGTWVLYQVDSVAYNDFTMTTDTFNFKVKELIESVFFDNQGRETYRIERYYMENSDTLWTIKNVWIANRNERTAEKVEDNIRYVKLIFPVKKNVKWDGNISNSYTEVSYEYTDVHINYNVNNHNFDSCIVVQHENEINPFQQKFSEEVYAKHIGCIYKNKVNLEKLADGTIVSGYNYTYKALSWGN